MTFHYNFKYVQGQCLTKRSRRSHSNDKETRQTFTISGSSLPHLIAKYPCFFDKKDHQCGLEVDLTVDVIKVDQISYEASATELQQNYIFVSIFLLNPSVFLH
jgi:hypothetical protein